MPTAPNVTVQMPNGEHRTMSVSRLTRELSRLTRASSDLGLGVALMLSVSTAAAPAQRVQLIAREAHTPAAPAPARTRTAPRARRAFNISKLKRAMKQPGFNGSQYAKKNKVSSSLVYHYLRTLKA